MPRQRSISACRWCGTTREMLTTSTPSFRVMICPHCDLLCGKPAGRCVQCNDAQGKKG